jgi:rod shape-determining protein MreC
VAYGGVDSGSLELRFMPANADIVQGDAVVTSGLDGVYPPGLPVASVARVERNVKDQFARVVLTPTAGVHNHSHLLVLVVDASKIPSKPAPEARRPERRGAKK